jgi:hypothetical protein
MCCDEAAAEPPEGADEAAEAEGTEGAREGSGCAALRWPVRTGAARASLELLAERKSAAGAAAAAIAVGTLN